MCKRQKEEGRQKARAWLLQQEEGRQILQKEMECGCECLVTVEVRVRAQWLSAPAVSEHQSWYLRVPVIMLFDYVSRFHIFWPLFFLSFWFVLRIISADNDFQIHCFYGDRSQFYRKLAILHSPLLGVPFCFFIQHLCLCWKSLCTCMLSMFASGHVPPGSFKLLCDDHTFRVICSIASSLLPKVLAHSFLSSLSLFWNDRHG